MTYMRENALGLSKTELARRAGVSLPTWRKWERNAASVTPRSAAKCKRALEELATRSRQATAEPAREGTLAQVAEAWEDGILTQRQACAISITLSSWAESDLQDWLDGRSDQPLYRVGPFAHFDLRVAMLIGENVAYAAMAMERCLAVDHEIGNGTLPFGRDGCYFDEVLMGAALPEAEEFYRYMPTLFKDIPERHSLDARVLQDIDDDEDFLLGDEDWEDLAEAFDSWARWDDWRIPVLSGHPLLPRILEIRHPFRWFDVAGLLPRDEHQHGEGEGGSAAP